MKRVVTINLGGNAYLLEEEGLAALSGYLANARTRLAGNPDIEEILGDLELAIADKARRFLTANKTVVTTAEVHVIIDEMGPVEGSSSSDATGDPLSRTTGGHTHFGAVSEGQKSRRLYKLTSADERVLTGVCAGLAAYSGLDVSIIRIAFVALTFATSGIAAIVYLVLALIVPVAETPQQQAAAYGIAFDARGLVDQTKTRLERTAGKQWRAQQRYWNRHARGATSGIGSFLAFGVLVCGLVLGLAWFGALHQSPLAVDYLGPVVGYVLLPWWSVPLLIGTAAYLLGRMAVARPRSGAGSPLRFVATVAVLILCAWAVVTTLFVSGMGMQILRAIDHLSW